jgi:hypothetical protein
MALQLGQGHDPAPQAGFLQCGIELLRTVGDKVIRVPCTNPMVTVLGRPLAPNARGCQTCEPQTIPQVEAVDAALGVAARLAIPEWKPHPWMTTHISHFIVDNDLSRLATVPQIFVWRIHESVQPSYLQLSQGLAPGNRPTITHRCFEGTNCPNWGKDHQPSKTICLCGQTRCESFSIEIYEIDDKGERILDDAGLPITVSKNCTCWDPATTLVSPINKNVHLCSGCEDKDRGFRECPKLFPHPAHIQRRMELKAELELQALTRSSAVPEAPLQPPPTPISQAATTKQKGDFKITSRGFWPMTETGAGYALRWSALLVRDDQSSNEDVQSSLAQQRPLRAHRHPSRAYAILDDLA